MWNTPTQEELSKIPPLYQTEGIPFKDKIIYMHFFIGACDWYIAEYDGEDGFFGYANLGDDLNAEWGYISFRELKETKIFHPIKDLKTNKEVAKLAIEIDHDLYWKSTKAADIPKIIFIDPL